MPGYHIKQVRFAYKNTFHSPPPTPALSDSTSSLPPSPELLTPESIEYGVLVSSSSPYAQSKSPYAQLKTPFAQLKSPSYPTSSPNCTYYAVPHPYLETSVLSWDVRDPPINAGSVSGWTLHDAATSPPASHVRITSPYLPWPIHCAPTLNGTFVSLHDVLHAIYHALRTNVRPAEFDMLSSTRDRRHASRAYQERYGRHRGPEVYEEEKRTGMKRVDFLQGRTRFCGLVSGGSDPGEWHLNVD